jgi:5'-deoxynucleotidase YfbR-like HD superfamily hydrolase
MAGAAARKAGGLEVRSLREKILFLRRGGEVQRFHTDRFIFPDTVATHSFGVAGFCYLLRGADCSRELLLAALFHDIAEQETGDIPAPTKRLLDIRAKCSEIEDEILAEYEIENRQLSPEDKRTLAFADVFDGMMACYRERFRGNKGVEKVYMTFLSYAEKLLSEPFDLGEPECSMYGAISDLWNEVL